MFDFLSLKTSINTIRERHSALWAQIQLVKNEIVSVHGAPPSRSDIVLSIDQWIKSSAQGFDEAVAANVKKGLDFGQLEGSGFKPGFLGLLATTGRGPTVQEMDGVLFKVFGHEIRNHIVSVVENMEWPSNYAKPGLPRAERVKKLEELSQKELNLRKELAKIVKDATDAGIDL